MTTESDRSKVTVRSLSAGRWQATFRGVAVIAADKERACELALELGERGGTLTTPPRKDVALAINRARRRARSA